MDDDLAWDDDDFEVNLPAPDAAPGVAVAQKHQESFEGEDDGVIEVAKKTTGAGADSGASKKPGAAKMEAARAAAANAGTKPLADPVAEKLRQVRLQEEADLKAAKELFGCEGEEEKNLSDIIPKTNSEFEEYGLLVAATYVKTHEKASQANYVALIKGLLRRSVASLKSDAIKEIESSVIAMRNERLKEEKAATSKKKNATKNQKKSLNSGALDEIDDQLNAGYDDQDDYDFM
ncbi:hypothetical protein PPROV_000971400 [Pycnococcus provasolii]|uniref:Uncharacterized protein n=1 Tax=Pycnococcus provasolii TaxID=41880 RepID=A0A6T5WZC5_9CHLO|nr:hypothetical protein PPROV_000971400 [Pycnococcus provasolii]|mmetsp:Transcript_1997/g.4358  ORF Transcript_1997/g.4358 Transcript_1997/m.4358 type:complete len:234 (+) Transcript_1997:56-757(+)